MSNSLSGVANWVRNNPLIIACCLGFYGVIALVIGVFWICKSWSEAEVLFIASGSAFAAAALMYTAYCFQIDSKERSSKFNLENYMKASEMILRRLKSDLPTRRSSWISAASMADKLLILVGKITEESDREFLDIYQRNFAHCINEFILEKPAIYFSGNDKIQSWTEAFQRPEIIATPGLIPNIPLIPYINRNTIKSILNLTNDIWEKENGYKYTNEDEFHNVINFNYPKLGEYLLELKKRSL